MPDKPANGRNGHSQPAEELDAVVVGAGFAGLYALHRLRGLGLSVRVFESGTGVGGTWYWNRYPGARCDVPSMQYSYQFSDELQQEWEWTERYASQPEILRYLNHVADRFDLRRDIRLETRVIAAHFDDTSGRWQVETDRGDRLSARYCIMATGCLSSRNLPSFPGLEEFAGETFHTGNWPHEKVDFTGKRVGIIGTGSSAVQAIPYLAAEAKELYVFQRTATYSVPARNYPLDPEVQRRTKADYKGVRERGAASPFGFEVEWNQKSALEVDEEERAAEYEKRWKSGGTAFYGVFADLLISQEANQTAGDYVRGKIRSIVRDPGVAELLSPKQTFGCKRICLDTDFYETFNRPNVHLVDVATAPIERLTERGLRTAAEEFELDAIIFATGFDAMTGALMRVDIRGQQGVQLRDKWAEGPRAYLGLVSAGFPNLFLITGPGSPSVLSNMVPAIEQHVNFVARLIEHMRERGIGAVDAGAQVENEWVQHVTDIASATLFISCNSWYLGSNIPGKPRVFMPYLGFPRYVAQCEEIVAEGYTGFVFSPECSAGKAGGDAVDGERRAS